MESLSEVSREDTADEEDEEELEIAPGLESEQNQFEKLCDGLVESNAVLRGAIQELLDLKDDLLTKALPPPAAARLVAVCSHVFRASADLDVPLFELVRLSNLYAKPWDQKSVALKQLYEQFGKKQRLLNLALKKLEALDGEAQKMEKHKKILNWEKLFSKVVASEGHGRRWKFLIEPFKKHAAQGFNEVQTWIRSMDEADVEGSLFQLDDLRDEHETLAQEEATQRPKTTSTVAASKRPASGSSQQTEESDTMTTKDAPTSQIEIQTVIEYQEKIVYAEAPKPETADKAIDTNEEHYEWFLHLRFYHPLGVKYTNIRCTVSYGSQVYLTEYLRPPTVSKKEEQPQPPTAQLPKGRRLLGRKSFEPRDTQPTPAGQEDGPPLITEVDKSLYEEEILQVEDTFINTNKAIDDPLRIAIHQGPAEKVFAVTTIGMNDIKSSLVTLDRKPMDICTVVAHENIMPSLEAPVALPEDSGSFVKETPKEVIEYVDSTASEVISGLEPTQFPMYSTQISGFMDSAAVPIGYLPVMFYLTRKVKPVKFDKNTEASSVVEIVYQETSIDLRNMLKEEIEGKFKRRVCERALSPIDFPDPVEEDEDMVRLPATRLKQMEEERETEMQQLREEYEQDILQLQHEMNQLEERLLQFENQEALAEFKQSVSPTRPGGGAIKIPRPPPKPRKLTTGKNFLVGKPLPEWGKDIPKDFMQRLKLYSVKSQHHKRELSARVAREISEQVEKQLADQHRLNKPVYEREYSLDDVSLPALFMPVRTGNVFNPRAFQYFHPTGYSEPRLTQPPSVFQLPPLHEQHISVMNLFELSQNFYTTGPSWVLQQAAYTQATDSLLTGNQETRRQPDMMIIDESEATKPIQIDPNFVQTVVPEHTQVSSQN